MTNQQAPEIYTLHTVPNKGERPWSGIYAVRADAEHDAKVMRDATGRDWSVVRLVVADTAATQTGPITRYEVVDCIDSKHVPAVIPNGAGPWVRYEDHIAALVEAQQPAPATQKLKEQICISDTNQSAACAVGSVGTTSDAQTTRSTHDAPATQQAGEVVAYLDIGAGGYLGSALSDEDLQQLPKGRHTLVIAGTYGIDGYVAAPQPSPTPQADSQPVLDRARIREIFMEHGFTVKEGQTDLKEYVYDAADALLRAARAPADSVCYDYAKQIAESMWATHYKADAPHWESCDSLMGVLSQISNMMCGLSRAPADSVTAPAATPTAASIAWTALRDLTDPLGEAGVKIMGRVRIYAQRQYEAGLAEGSAARKQGGA